MTLTIEDVATARDEGSVVTATGTDEEGRRVTFAGDSQPMVAMLEALVTDQEDEVSAEVEDWAVLRIDCWTEA